MFITENQLGDGILKKEYIAPSIEVSGLKVCTILSSVSHGVTNPWDTGDNVQGGTEPWESDGDNTGGYAEGWESDGDNTGGYAEGWESDGDNTGGYAEGWESGGSSGGNSEDWTTGTTDNF